MYNTHNNENQWWFQNRNNSSTGQLKVNNKKKKASFFFVQIWDIKQTASTRLHHSVTQLLFKDDCENHTAVFWPQKLFTNESKTEVPTNEFPSFLRFAESVLGGSGEADDVIELEESFRMGLVRLAAGGGFNRSATPDDAAPSDFFTFTGPELEELPSNTIRGLFLLWSFLELWINVSVTVWDLNQVNRVLFCCVECSRTSFS